MRKSSGEAIINTKELNKILPSYLLNEVEEDNINYNLNEELNYNTNFNEKVSKIFFKP
jgi:hypothetical protein